VFSDIDARTSLLRMMLQPTRQQKSSKPILAQRVKSLRHEVNRRARLCRNTGPRASKGGCFTFSVQALGGHGEI